MKKIFDKLTTGMAIIPFRKMKIKISTGAAHSQQRKPDAGGEG